MKFSLISKFVTYFLSLLILLIIAFSFFSVTLTDLSDIARDKEFINAVIFGVSTASIATVLSSIFGIPAGFYLARSKKWYVNLLDMFFDIPLIIPPLIVGVLVLNFVNKTGLNEIFEIIFTLKGAVIAQFFISFPFTLKSSKNAFELISPIYERIAMTLGAGYFQSFYDTTFKLASKGILTGLILSWLRSFGEFGATLIVAGGIPSKTENVPINIYLNMMEGNFSKGLAASFLTIIFAFVLMVGIRFVIKRR